MTVSIIGVGQTSVSEKWETSLRHLAWYAVEAALDDAHTTDIDAIFVGNMAGGSLSRQRQLGALVADFAGLRGAEAIRVEAGEASGGATVRQAVMAVTSGLVKTALVVGVEKAATTSPNLTMTEQATALDAEYEQAHGLTMASSAALVMRRYMHEYGVEVADFANFSVNAHANGGKNPNAMYRNRLKGEKFTLAPQLAEPVSLFDAAPAGDGAAALIITSTERAADMVANPIEIAGSALVTDTVAVHDRTDILWLDAAAKSARLAMEMAGVAHEDIDLFELHDGFTILAAMSLEAAGFAAQGEGVSLAKEGAILADGSIPISTFGGLKARGNPMGATGVYQLAEVAQQLRGQAGPNQIEGVSVGLAQNLGGFGATAVTHVLKK